MKKILICSLIFCSGFMTQACFADGETCRKTADGKIVCNYHETGGPTEKDKCMHRTDFNKNHVYKITTNKTCSCYLDDWVRWYEDGHACSPTGAPVNSGVCRLWTENGKKTIGYRQKSMADTDPVCPTNAADLCDNTSYNLQTITEDITSCAAKECNPGWLLYVTNTKHEIPVVGATPAQKVRSQGLCRQKTWVQKNLCDKGCGCGDHEKCVVNEVVVLNYGKNVPAYIGEEACICESDGTPPPVEEYCEYKFSADVTCYTDGKTKTITKDSLKIPKSMFGENCPENTTVPDFKEWYETQRAEVVAWFKENCPQTPQDAKNSKITVDFQRLQNAQAKLDAFFDYAKSNRSGWKTADGKFNTTRLASDITAGVVLGTVGGVVSGVVIKKKQVEKGFDALHCTVGGQKVAGWGDEFSVGLQR